MSERLPIFSEAGSFSVSDIKDSNGLAYVAITAVRLGTSKNGSQSSTTDKLYAYMPVTGVLVNQSVDMSISKTLNSDFLVSEFGDHPVQITLTGIDFFGATCDSEQKKHQQILDFYQKWKLSTNINNRIDVSITQAASPVNGAFRCILMKMKTTAPGMDGQGLAPVYRYEIDLIGVRRRVKGKSK